MPMWVCLCLFVFLFFVVVVFCCCFVLVFFVVFCFVLFVCVRERSRGMCYPVCGMMHIKEPLLLIGKSSPCSGSGFPLSLSEWSFTIF